MAGKQVAIPAFTEFSHHMGIGRPRDSYVGQDQWLPIEPANIPALMRVCLQSALAKTPLFLSNLGREVIPLMNGKGVGVPNQNVNLSMSPLARFVLPFSGELKIAA